MALTCVVEPGDARIAPLVEEFGAADVWAGLRRPGPVVEWARRAATVDLDRVRGRAEELGLRFLVPGDADWPQQLSVLGTCEPVVQARGVPLGLWVRGYGSLAELSERSVSIVGSRASTPYGDRVAADWAAGLAASGLTVVSGAAYGIDASAHRGALAEGGPTVAFVAGGLDVPYPRNHEPLLASIARAGLVVSELPPGEHPTRLRFLTRNRLIAALSGGTVIVEGAHRSGARNTVTWARACGRPVMAAPGAVTSAMSATPHRLVRDGEAVLVTSVEEIREEIGSLGEFAPARPDQGRLLDFLDPAVRAVYEALPGRGSRDLGDLAVRAGVSVPQAAAAMAELAERGLAEPASDGGWRIGTTQNRPERPRLERLAEKHS